MQETNLVLCRKAGEYFEGSNFAAWALQVAHFQVMAHRQSLARGRLVFQDETIRELVDVATGRIETMGEREEALRLCLARLPKRSGKCYRVATTKECRSRKSPASFPAQRVRCGRRCTAFAGRCRRASTAVFPSSGQAHESKR